jgi:hypothetical protein
MSGTSEVLPGYRQLTAYKVSNAGACPFAIVRSTMPLTTSVGTTLMACAALVSEQLTVVLVSGIVTLHVRAVEIPFFLSVNAYWLAPSLPFRTRAVMYSLSNVQLVGIGVSTKLSSLLRPSDVMDERGTRGSGQKAIVGPGSLKRP